MLAEVNDAVLYIAAQHAWKFYVELASMISAIHFIVCSRGFQLFFARCSLSLNFSSMPHIEYYRIFFLDTVVRLRISIWITIHVWLCIRVSYVILIISKILICMFWISKSKNNPIIIWNKKNENYILINLHRKTYI